MASTLRPSGRGRWLFLSALLVAAWVCGFYIRGKISVTAIVAGVRARLGLEQPYERLHAGTSGIEAKPWPGVPSPRYPQWHVRRGLDVERIATGFTQPIHIVFRAQPEAGPDAPLYYVNELHGTVHWVARDGQVHELIGGLTPRDPITMPGSDEIGLSGMTAVPGSDDLILTGAFLDAASGLLKNRILRLRVRAGGREVERVDTLLVLDEFTSPSHQIQQVVWGADDTLYVSVGDGKNHLNALDLNRFGGKILRMNPDGTAAADNPFFDPDAPTAPRSYVWVYGVRNSFDMTLDPLSGGLFASESGQSLDRLFRVQRGASYGWNGNDDSTRLNALYTWGPWLSATPVGVTILRSDVLGADHRGDLLVATWGRLGPHQPNSGKQILRFRLAPDRQTIVTEPEVLLSYAADTFATVLGLGEGPDGLYFTDFFGEIYKGSEEGQASVWRLFPSQGTLDLPTEASPTRALDAGARGKLTFRSNCAGCHQLAGFGGSEGPALDGVRGRLEIRLSTRGYEAQLDEYLRSDLPALRSHRGRLQEVRDATGPDRIRRWLENHLQEPRFDNPYGKMPSFHHLSDEQLADLVTLLETS